MRCEAEHVHTEMVHGVGPDGEPGVWLVNFLNWCEDEGEHEIHHARGWAWL
jgi:hypothetical protein